MTDRNTISLITPSLNSAKVICDCISSVEEQGPEVEHIVVDGESSDGTVAVVGQYGTAVHLLIEPPAGIYAAINSGIGAAMGEIVGVLHADDYYSSPDVLDRVSGVFKDPSIDACFGDLCYIDGSNPSRIVRYWQAGPLLPKRFYNGWMPPHPTFFLRRDLYEKHGLYRTDLGTAADYELMLRMLLKQGIQAAYIPKVLVKMRTGGASNASWSARLAANRMDRRAWEVNGLKPRPWTLLAKPLRKLPQWWQRPDS